MIEVNRGSTRCLNLEGISGCGFSGNTCQRDIITTDGCTTTEDKLDCKEYEQIPQSCDINECTYVDDIDSPTIEENEALEKEDYPSETFYYRAPLDYVEVTTDVLSHRCKYEINGELLLYDCNGENLKFFPDRNLNRIDEPTLTHYEDDDTTSLRITASVPIDYFNSENLAEPEPREYYRFCATTDEQYAIFNPDTGSRELRTLYYPFAFKI